jgi:hypothetical protein
MVTSTCRACKGVITSGMLQISHLSPIHVSGLTQRTRLRALHMGCGALTSLSCPSSRKLEVPSRQSSNNPRIQEQDIPRCSWAYLSGDRCGLPMITSSPMSLSSPPSWIVQMPPKDGEHASLAPRCLPGSLHERKCDELAVSSSPKPLISGGSDEQDGSNRSARSGLPCCGGVQFEG